MKRLLMCWLMLCPLSGFAALGTSRAQAATLTVTTLNDDPTVDGCTNANTTNGCTLREAITDANATPHTADDIVFADGLAGQTLTLTSALPDIMTPLAIRNTATRTITLARSKGATEFGVLGVYGGGGDKKPLAAPTGPTVALQGLTLTGGITPNNLGVSLSGLHGVFRNNSGGGLYVENSAVTLTNCELRSNTSISYGGGLCNFCGAVTLINSGVADNTASIHGGGIINIEGTMTLVNSTVAHNTCSLAGGGIEASEGTVTLTNCTVSGNTSTEGGGLYSQLSTLTLTNCTIAGNTVGDNGYGGGLCNNNAATLRNCTITGNTAAANRGSGIDVGYGITTLSNTIVAGNTNSDLDRTSDKTHNGVVSNGYNLVGTAGADALASFAQDGDMQVRADDLKLGPLQDNGGPTQTCALQPGSIAFNAGNPDTTGLPSTDQRGLSGSRISGGRVDVGAYEAQATTIQGDVYNTLSRRNLSGLVVQAVLSDNTVAGRTLIDSGGHYTLTLIPGTYTLEVTNPNAAAFRFAPLFANPVTLDARTPGTASYDFRSSGRVVARRS